MTGAAVKRALWCRWFHRYRWRHGKRPQAVVSTDPGTGQSLRMTAGPGRTLCDACADRDYGRALKQWLAS